tara:strand:- start:226 stop:918 length:693 start_codon:yes stop_codon:yes gene_type:complete
LSQSKNNYNDVVSRVETFYYDNHRVLEDGSRQGLNIYENNAGKLEGGRQHDPIYNDENAKYQIYTFGCSWTYGWDLPQEQTFTHLLGDKNTAVYNYGAGGTGLDFAVKTLSEVYIPNSTRQIFIITIPHLTRRVWFDDDGVALRAWQVKEQTDINEYNGYYNFLHNYELLNRTIGRDKIIWGTWDEDVPIDKVDVFFHKTDKATDNLHPGPESHKKYSKDLKNVLQNRFK